MKPLEYGPKFSRGKILDFENDKVKKIYVSGTSSVDKKGKSALIGDYDKNIDYVISCVEHLLKNSNTGSKILLCLEYIPRTARPRKLSKGFIRIKSGHFLIIHL